MYNTAYTTQFGSLDGRMWTIVISINNYHGHPREISLDGDAPCVIEWPETDKQDVVQASICTLRVSNESDRQMMPLISHHDAVVSIGVDGRHYWYGHLDDSIYEEPYSFRDGYVTELTFSDFGILNRKPFDLTGKQSVMNIVRHCLELTSTTPLMLRYMLRHAEGGAVVDLKDIFINADRFRADDDGDNWGGYTSRLDVLEEVLRPLGLRLFQKGGAICIYDIESLRDNLSYQQPVRWKGTDACIKGSETYGWYEVAFEPDADETLAETKLNLDDCTVGERFYARYYDDDLGEWDKGYFIHFPAHAALNSNGRVFKTQPFLSSSDDIGYAWRVWCHDELRYGECAVLNNRIVHNIAGNNQNTPMAEALFKIETGYLPVCPDSADYQMRVNLDLLLSPKRNPMEADADWNFDRVSQTIRPTTWKENLLQVYVPVKLELLNEQGNVLMHYKNTRHGYYPYDPGNGQWLAGAASSFGDMLLAYYNDGLEETALGGWATNRQAMNVTRKYMPSLYKKREDGEYVPLPPSAGIVRLTVSNCVFSPNPTENQTLLNFENHIRWHLLRNAKITLVKANAVDDGIPTDTVYNRQSIDQNVTTQRDKTSETLQANTWCEGVAPSARGLYFDAAGKVFEEFLKNEQSRTLSEHRLHCHMDQTIEVHPVLSGTAELNLGFVAHTDSSTPGPFLVTALLQDLHQGTEEITMARIAPVGGYCYEYHWGDAVCVKEEVMYSFAWSDPICATR